MLENTVQYSAATLQREGENDEGGAKRMNQIFICSWKTQQYLPWKHKLCTARGCWSWKEQLLMEVHGRQKTACLCLWAGKGHPLPV